MVNCDMEVSSSSEMQCEDDRSAIIELVDVDINNSLLVTTLDMTSLAAFVYADRDRREPSSSGASYTEEEEEDDYRLTLAYERLHTVPKTLLDRFGPTLQILDISHNKIRNLGFLSHFKSLTSLIADNNFIDEDTTFPPMPHLQLLWLNHCKIDNLFPWVRKLRQSCPGLKHICLMGNPAAPSYLNGGTFYEYLQYRLLVISLFPHLVHLDDRAVSQDQRQEAERLHRRPLLERLAGFSAADCPSLGLHSGALARWRALHNKMAALFDSNHSVPTFNKRNLLV